MLPFLSLLFLSYLLNAQEVQPVFTWEASAKKTGEGVFEITFSTQGAGGWELYAPQIISEIKTTEIVFPDSNIRHQGSFEVISSPKTINSTIFEMPVQVYEGPAEWKTTVQINGPVPANLHGVLQYTFGKVDEFYPATPFHFSVALEGGVASATRIRIDAIDLQNTFNKCGDEDTANKSLMGIFILGFIGGLIALVTPCVFPLIPLTVSFFTKRSKSRKKGIFNATIYGFFIFLIYILLSIPFHLLDQTNPEVLNNISTNVWLNLLFFAIFVVFAISFFGYFEIGLPSSFASKMDSKAGISDWGGIFFMALTLAIVSFSCTGPILGSLLAGALSSDGGAMQLSFGMGGFGLGLALPFALFALFPGWLQTLPKSGGWLTTVKVVLGFLELAMAVKFFSNADLVKQWGLLPREIFMAIWIGIGLAIVLYLSGFIRFPHDSKLQKISASRWTFIIIFGALTLYLVPGVTNTKWANLKLISGFPPPLCYSIYDDPVNCKKGFEPLKDYDQALALARKDNKPLLIDFTGWACVNCRRMEEKVWPDPVVDSLMRTHFVVVSLYVDERRSLPLTEQIPDYQTKQGIEKSIITIGDKWATFQSENFDAVAQPQYAILDTDESALTKTKAYTPDADEFAEWLRCGLDAFERYNKEKK
ncbi:MAG: thioredoxin family protein [Chitinophagaceae bacterium]|nr:thioredoxin family protein [Chitinophagaceae bacterium]